MPDSTDEFQIIAGNRRVRAARAKGLRLIEAKVVDVDDETAELMSLEENLRRKALPDEPTHIARLLDLYKRKGASKRGGDRRSLAFQEANCQRGSLNHAPAKAIAKIIGQSERDVYRKAKIGRAAAAVRSALEAGLIGINEAEKLASLPTHQQPRRVAALVQKNKIAPATGWPVELHRALHALERAELWIRAHSQTMPADVAERIRERASTLLKLVPDASSTRRRA